MTEHHETSDGTTLELWPTKFLEAPDSTTQSQTDGSTALLLLNSPISDYGYFHRIYEHASLRVCIDGGANRLHDLMMSRSSEGSWQERLGKLLPDVIHGDLDSLDETVRQRYEELGVEVLLDPDQFSTDFGKGVKLITQRLPNLKNVLVFGSVGGRVDQGIGLLGELYREQTLRHPGIRFWLFSEISVSTLLKAGTTVLHTPLDCGLIERNMGVLPLYGPAIITMKGFEWDVEDWPTQMGGQVSTSNHIMGPHISIKTNTEVLFTVERTVHS